MSPRVQVCDKGESPYLTPTQACDYLQISMSTLQRLIASEDLKAYRLGRSRTRRFLIEDLNRLLVLENVSNERSDITQYVWGRVG